MKNPSILLYIDALFIGAAASLFLIGYLLHLKQNNLGKNNYLTYGTAVVVSIFVLAYSFLNSEIPYQPGELLLVAVISFIMLLTIFFSTQKEYANIAYVIFPAFIIGSGFVIAFGTQAFYSILNGNGEIKLLLLLSTYLFSILTMFVGIRFFLQISQSELKQVHWVIIGSCALGFSITSLRFSVLASVDVTSPFQSQVASDDLSIMPFTLMIFCIIVMELVISIVSENTRNLNRKMFDALLNNQAIAILTTDNEGIILHANQTTFKITGYKPIELKGLSFADYVVKNSKESRKIVSFSKLVTSDDTHFSINKKNKSHIDLQFHYIPLKKKNQVIGWYIIIKDITAHKKMEEDMNYLIDHDILTGLSNRKAFQEQIYNKVNAQEQFTVFVLGIDRFKRVNEMKGHIIGDALLKQISERLLSLTRKEDRLSRVGGDEYAFLLNHSNQLLAKKYAAKIIEAMKKPFIIAGEEYFLTCSVGISIYPENGSSAETLLKHAASALERAKDERIEVCVYSDVLSIKKENRYQIENDLRKVKFSKEFKVYYQPQMDLRTGKISGVEALIRWQHPVKGLIPPDKFIPIAEEMGMIKKIGEWVLYEACKQNKRWQKEGLPKLRVSVNLAMEQFYDENFINKLKYILKKTELDPKYLDLEITESMALKDLSYSLNTFNQIKKLGVQLSIDDFGKGYSSFHHLKVIPIDRIKIDKSFVKDVPDNKEAKVIIRSILTLAKNLKLTSVAEGVENITQENILRELNCNELQGYFYSPPIQAKELRRILTV
jgi:diguanylate cyclase (GGDEF)-like protein/PAS domain S-box-containing protein